MFTRFTIEFAYIFPPGRRYSTGRKPAIEKTVNKGKRSVKNPIGINDIYVKNELVKELFVK